MNTSLSCQPLAELIQWLEPVFVPEQDVDNPCGPWLLREVDVLLPSPRRYWECAASADWAQHQRLQLGDVIVHPQYLDRATVVGEKYVDFVACAPLLVCRILGHDRLLPAYLAWLFGTDLMKAMLFDAMRVTHIGAIGPKDLNAVSIPLVGMALQTQIAQCWQDLVARERDAFSAVSHIRQQIDRLLLQQVRVASNPGMASGTQSDF